MIRPSSLLIILMVVCALLIIINVTNALRQSSANIDVSNQDIYILETDIP